MSGNPHIGNENIDAFREAYHEMVNGLHINRMNRLHQYNKDERIDFN